MPIFYAPTVNEPPGETLPGQPTQDTWLSQNSVSVLYGDSLVISSGLVVSLDSGALAYLRADDSTATMASSVYSVLSDATLVPQSTTITDDDPVVIASGVKLEIPEDAVLWTDAPRSPQFVSQLLWITA